MKSFKLKTDKWEFNYLLILLFIYHLTLFTGFFGADLANERQTNGQIEKCRYLQSFSRDQRLSQCLVGLTSGMATISPTQQCGGLLLCPCSCSLLKQLAPEALTRFKTEHLAGVTELVKAQDLVDCGGLFTLG